MPINWRTDYGIRLVYELTRLGDSTRATVRQLSEAAEVPYDYARTIVRDLVAQGILTSRRGVGGGVELARPSADITVLDVFHALSEPASLALCTKAGGTCSRSGTCPLHKCIWRELDEMIAGYLSKVDFATAANLGRGLEVD